MKKILTILGFSFIMLLMSCGNQGTSYLRLNGNEPNLPDELKGLRVYTVETGPLSYVKVAILDGKVNSTTYSHGKTTESTIILDKRNNNVIQISSVLMENDSIIVCRKQ